MAEWSRRFGCPRLVSALALALAVLAGAPVARAQAYPNEPFGDAAFPELRRRAMFSLPALSFRLHTEIPVPGPLPDARPRVRPDGRVELPVAGGIVVTELKPGATPRLQEETEPPVPDGGFDETWVYSADGKRRFRTQSGGRIIAERCCTWFRKSWRREWMLRIAGGTVAPPLVVGNRVFVGALDNQVYALRVHNGHRLWTADVGQRVSNALALWRGPAPRIRSDGKRLEEQRVDLILVVLESGSAMLALDADTGRKVATYELPEDAGSLVGAPAATGDGDVVVARQRYAESDASLLVLRLEPPNAVAAGTPAEPPQDAPGGR